MSNYLAWNHALGDYFFHPQRACKWVTLYIDRKRIEEIGRATGLGGWQEFIAAAKARVHVGGHASFDQLSPLRLANQLLDVWEAKEGVVDSHNLADLPHAPVWIGYALLILAWTEADLQGERSYYDRLNHFLRQAFPDLVHEPKQRLGGLVAHFAEALPKLSTWLPLKLGPTAPKLMVGNISQHRYVGAIRFHALLSPEERAYLPLIWKEFRLDPMAPVPEKRLLELIRQSEHLGAYLPGLQRTLNRLNDEGLGLLGELLLGELRAWDGAEPPSTPKSIPLQRSPKIRIRWEGELPDAVYLEWAHSLEPLSAGPHQYETVRVPGTLWLELRHAETGEKVVPDTQWLFGEIELTNATARAVRTARHHLWFHHVTTQGYHQGGYIEVPRPILGASFKLLTDAIDLQVAQQSRELALPPESLKVKEVLAQCWRFQAPALASNPFQKERLTLSQSRMILSSKGKLREGHFLAEVPLLAEVGPPLSGAFIHAYTDGAQSLSIHQSDEGCFHLDLPIDAPNGSHILVLKDATGHPLHEVRIHLIWREPLCLEDLDQTEGYDPQGNWCNLEDAGRDLATLFLHNSFIGVAPQIPVPAQIRVELSHSEQPRPRTHPDLGAQLLVHARKDGSLRMDAFKEVVQAVAEARAMHPLSNAELHEVRRNLTALGFLHYDYEAREIQLSPLTIALLPFDHCDIKALLLGPVPQSLANWLGRWESPAHLPIQLHWRMSEAPLLPPLLELQTNSIEALEHLRNEINQHFSRSIAPIMPCSLAQSLLAWLAPIPATPAFHHEVQHQWSSFPEHEERWDVYACGFMRSADLPRFPVLTRAKQRFGGAWDCVLWDSAARGFLAGHHSAIPFLHHHARIPYIGQNAEKTDEILLAGRHRQSDLLERALVLATGRLPQRVPVHHISEWEGLFAPDAVFRKFSGIRPDMRIQLTRIFRHVLHLDPAHPFPKVHIHPPKAI